MKKVLSLPVLFLLMSFHQLFAQGDFKDGYLITNEYDTIIGQISYSSTLARKNVCQLKQGDLSTEYTAGQIKGFRLLNDKLYTTEILEGEFVEVLVRGELSLYKAGSKFLVKTNKGELHTLETGKKNITVDGKYKAVKDNRWKGILRYLLKDCINLNSSVKNVSLREKSLTDIVIRYNTCRQAEYVVFKEDKPWTKVKFGVSVGLGASAIKFTETDHRFDYVADNYRAVVPAFGLVMVISSPRAMERIAFQSELLFRKSRFSSIVSDEDRSQVFSHESEIDLTTLSLPVSFKYALPVAKNSLFFQTGLEMVYNMQSKSTFRTEEYYGDDVYVFINENTIKVSDSRFGVWAGAGIVRPFKYFDASVNLRYFFKQKLTDMRELTAYTERLSLSLIIMKK